MIFKDQQMKVKNYVEKIKYNVGRLVSCSEKLFSKDQATALIYEIVRFITTGAGTGKISKIAEEIADSDPMKLTINAVSCHAEALDSICYAKNGKVDKTAARLLVNYVMAALPETRSLFLMQI